MEIYSVYSEEFKKYGKVITGYDTKPLVEAMKQMEVTREEALSMVEALWEEGRKS